MLRLSTLYLLCLLSNLPALWTHAWEGATESRALILDFVGMGFRPSRLHLFILDILILFLHLLLLTISYENALGTLHQASSEPSLPISPFPDDVTTPLAAMNTDESKVRTNKRDYVLDLRWEDVWNRLCRPAPVSATGRSSISDVLPLPITAQLGLPANPFLSLPIIRRERERNTGSGPPPRRDESQRRRGPGATGNEGAGRE